METIRLRVNSKVYKTLMWFLQRFTKDEILVINENDEYLSVKQYLQKELESVEDGTAKYIGIEQLDSELESTIRKYEV